MKDTPYQVVYDKIQLLRSNGFTFKNTQCNIQALDKEINIKK